MKVTFLKEQNRKLDVSLKKILEGSLIVHKDIIQWFSQNYSSAIDKIDSLLVWKFKIANNVISITLMTSSAILREVPIKKYPEKMLFGNKKWC